MTIDFFLPSEFDTRIFGERLAPFLKSGDTLLLRGDLGVGKSSLARSIIQTLCPGVEVPSPTFTLVQNYQTTFGDIWHVDLYRLSNSLECLELGLFEAMGECLCLIEWPERLEGGGPLEYLDMSLGMAPQGQGRTLACTPVFSYRDDLIRLLQEDSYRISKP